MEFSIQLYHLLCKEGLNPIALLVISLTTLEVLIFGGLAGGNESTISERLFQQSKS